MILASVFLSAGLGASSSVMADAGVFVGVVYDFGSKSDVGFSVKLVSDDETDKAVGAIGVSYFPASANKLGADISIGYAFDDVLDNALVTVGYDIFNKKPQVGLGYMDTKR